MKSRGKFAFLYSLFFLIVVFISGCTSTVDASALEVQIESLSIPILLKEEEQISVLDINEDLILVQTFHSYKEGESEFRETGYNEKTHTLGLWNWNEEKFEWEWNFSTLEGYCTNAIILDTDTIVYTLIVPYADEDGYSYRVLKHEIKSGSEFEITIGSCYGTGYDDPRLVALGEGSFVYSYAPQEDNRFGIMLVDCENNIKPILELEEDGTTEHLRSTLSKGGDTCIYYAAVKGKGTIYQIDCQGVVGSFSIPSNERVYDFCPWGENILFTMQCIDGEQTIERILVKDIYGNNITMLNYEPLYRLCSNGNNIAVGINKNWNPNLIYELNGELKIETLALPERVLHFYSSNDHLFFASLYDETKRSLFLISV